MSHTLAQVTPADFFALIAATRYDGRVTKDCLFALLLCAGASRAWAQAPSIQYAVPSAVRPGESVDVNFHGSNLRGPTQLWASFPAEVMPGASDTGNSGARHTFKIAPDAPIGVGAIRLATPNGVSSLSFLMIDDLTSLVESGTNTSMPAAQELAMPVAVDGQSDELAMDFYRVTVAKAQELRAELVAQRLGFEMDPVLRVIDSKGRELAYCDDAPGLGADARVECFLPQPGAYFLEVRDTRYRGGARFRYRLRLGGTPLPPDPYLHFEPSWFGPAPGENPREQFEVEPNSAPANATEIRLPALIRGEFRTARDRDLFVFDGDKGQRLVFAGKTRSLGSPCDLLMQLQKADGSVLAEANISGANEGTLTNTLATSGKYHLAVEELNQMGGPGLFYQIRVAPLAPGFELSMESEKFDAVPGGTFEVKVSCLRREYDGPIALAVLGETEGWQLANPLIPGKTNEVTLKITVPSNLEPGTLRHFALLGYARHGESYLESRASTMPAIRKLLPTFVYPPTTFDGWIGLGIKAPPKKEDPPRAG